MEDLLQSWEAQLRAYDLPEWDSLPELELYMDQVVLLLSRYLTFFSQGEEEKIITPSIVNNYVRMKVMPAPNKKRYSRIHIAYLLMICTLKQSLSIAAIRKLLPLELDEEQVRAQYTRFVTIYRAAAAHFSQILRDAPANVQGLDVLSAGMAILSCLSKSLTDYLLRDPSAEKAGQSS